MRYLTGSLTDLQRLRAAIDKLAGMPFPVEAVPIPPRAPTYSPFAIGWMEHVLEEPHDIGGGAGLQFVTDDINPYLGKSTEIDGQTVTVPTAEQLLEREQLPEAERTWLADWESPPEPG